MKVCGGVHGGSHEEVIVFVEFQGGGLSDRSCPLCAKINECLALLVTDEKKSEQIEILEGDVASLEFDLEEIKNAI